MDYSLKNLLHNEPVVLASTLRVILLAGMAFGLELSAEQMTAVIIAIEAVLAAMTRARVSPTAKDTSGE
jgi:hypothetical protein